MKRIILIMLAFFVVAALTFAAITIRMSDDDLGKPTLTLVGFDTSIAEHPSDLLLENDYIIATELRSNRVVKKTERNAVVKSPAIFHSPHFITSTGTTIFVSAGWGKDIYKSEGQIDEFEALPLKNYELNAPHGICIKDDWLYIADSLNSKLVRTRLNGGDVQIFQDNNKLVSYGRQLLCNETGVWIANSYESRPGLNKGIGSNVLLIEDFDSGESRIIAEFPTSNITGIQLIGSSHIVVGLWKRNRLKLIDLASPNTESTTLLALPSPYSGPPYGMQYDAANATLYVAFIGDLYKKGSLGGIAKYRVTYQ